MVGAVVDGLVDAEVVGADVAEEVDEVEELEEVEEVDEVVEVVVDVGPVVGVVVEDELREVLVDAPGAVVEVVAPGGSVVTAAGWVVGAGSAPAAPVANIVAPTIPNVIKDAQKQTRHVFLLSGVSGIPALNR